MIARLNIFQKTQRLWDTYHPYNAAQAAALAQRFEPEAITRAFNAAIADLRLGHFVCDGSRYWIEPSPPAAVVFTGTSLAEHVSGQMNRAFDGHCSFPFRPFVCVENGHQIIGVVYQHWTADSVSIRSLIRQWILRLVGQARPWPMSLPTAGMWRTFGGHTAGWSLTAELARQFGIMSRMKRMRRVTSGSFTRGDSAVLSTTVLGIINGLRSNARSRGATVGDVFLAAATEACSLYGANAAVGNRRDLSMGTIVDLRGKSNVPERVFGLYLGFMTTPFAAGELALFDTILSRAIAQRRANLHQHAAEASQVRMGLGYAMGKLLGKKKLLEFYRKRFALAGGLSSVNLTPSWAGELHPHVIADYWRISPPGPFMPIVFTPTTLGDRLTICCTYRTALFDREKAQRVLGCFVERLRRFAS